MKSVPKLYKTRATQLLDKIKENSDVLNCNKKGELLYKNKPIPGSLVVDLFNDMLHHCKGFEPMGWSVFARGLTRMSVPVQVKSACMCMYQAAHQASNRDMNWNKMKSLHESSPYLPVSPKLTAQLFTWAEEFYLEGERAIQGLWKYHLAPGYNHF